MRRQAGAFIGSLGVLVVVLSGCTTTADQDTIDRMRAGADQASEIGDVGFELDVLTDAERACVDQRLEDVDVATAMGDSSRAGDEERMNVVQSFLDCADTATVADGLTASLVANLNAGVQGLDLDPDEGECVVLEVLTNAENPAEAVAVAVTDDSLAVFDGAAESCLDDASLTVWRGGAGDRPQDVGDDPATDELFAACEDGDGPACDLLYLTTPEGSEYHDLGLTCAGRGTGDEYCTPGVRIDADGEFDESSPAVAPLRDDCGSGDMVACDLLYQLTPIGSDLERFSGTCGERLPTPAIPHCRARFPD